VDPKKGKKCFDQLWRCRGESFAGCEGVQMPMGTMTYETAVLRAKGIAESRAGVGSLRTTRPLGSRPMLSTRSRGPGYSS